MTEVIIAGMGQTPVGEHWEAGLRDLALDAIRDAVADSGGMQPQALYVGNMLAANLSNQAHLGVLLAEYAGFPGIEAVAVEAAGASGGAALRQGYLAVASGMIDVAVVVGVEKFTDKIGPDVEAALATSSDADFEGVQGLTPTAQAALVMRRYMHEFDVPRDGFAAFPLVAHANGAGNPKAMFRQALRPEDYAKAPGVSEPLNQLDVAPNGDGAAAVILTRRELVKRGDGRSLVRLAGSGAAADTLALHDRKDVLTFECCQISVEKALRQAGISLDDVSLFEYHDSYSIYAALALEAAGFAARGAGWRLAAEGSIGRNGKIPGATMGGLKARGFAGGATGVYQAVEAALQIQSGAGTNQIPGAKVALIQSMGGPATTVVTHVLTLAD